MAETPPTRRRLAAEIERLRTLAAWYREFAERAGNPAIWEARLRTAADLEAEAERLECSVADADPSTESDEWNSKLRALRDEAHSLVEKAIAADDPKAKQQLAAQALALAQRAEAIARSQEDLVIVIANIDRYRDMLRIGVDDKRHRELIEQLLYDAEAILISRRRASIEG